MLARRLFPVELVVAVAAVRALRFINTLDPAVVVVEAVPIPMHSLTRHSIMEVQTQRLAREVAMDGRESANR